MTHEADGVRNDRVGVFVPRWAMDDCGGDPRDAMVLAQVSWWLQPTQRDGRRRSKRITERDDGTWLYLTDDELADELGMTAKQVRGARLKLVKDGLIVTRSAQVKGRKVTLLRLADLTNRANPSDQQGGASDQTGESDSPNGSDPPSIDRGIDREDPGAVAREITTAWWEERKAAGNPPVQKFIGIVKVIEDALRHGVKRSRLEWAIREVPVVSAGALELAIQRRLAADGGASANGLSDRQQAAREALRDHQAAKR